MIQLSQGYHNLMAEACKQLGVNFSELGSYEEAKKATFHPYVNVTWWTLGECTNEVTHRSYMMLRCGVTLFSEFFFTCFRIVGRIEITCGCGSGCVFQNFPSQIPDVWRFWGRNQRSALDLPGRWRCKGMWIPGWLMTYFHMGQAVWEFDLSVQYPVKHWSSDHSFTDFTWKRCWKMQALWPLAKTLTPELLVVSPLKRAPLGLNFVELLRVPFSSVTWMSQN